MRDAHGGFILVSTLAALALFALLVGGVSLLVRSAVADARLARDELAADALTQAGLELAAYQLFMIDRRASDITDQQVRLDAGTVTLSTDAEDGKVDLNGADADLLTRLWPLAGGGPLTPQAFAARVVDWRDPDDARGPSGAEHAEYAGAGRTGAPANAPFAMVDDLQNVLGVEAGQVAALKPFVTVHNPAGKVSAMSAPREVLRLLPNATPAIVERIIALRRTPGPETGKQIAALLGTDEKEIAAGPENAFSVHVVARSATLSRTSVYTIVRGVDDARLFRVTDHAKIR